MYDNNLVLRSAGVGTLTSTETATAVQINETPIDGLSCNVIVPKQSSGTTLQVTIQDSTDNTTFSTLAVLEMLASSTLTTGGPFRQRKRFVTRGKYLRTITAVLGTSPSYGAVEIFLGDRDNNNNYTTVPATTLDTF